jgi:hypothetical protein
MGYYNGTDWKTYMSSSGDFYLSGTDGYLQWNSAADSLSIKGNITATTGYIGNSTNGFAINGNYIANGKSSIADAAGRYTGAHRTGFEPEVKSTTATAAAPAGPTAYEQYAKAEKAMSEAAAAGASKQEMRDIGLALMLGGAKTLSGKSQYAAQNIGEGLESGLTGFIGLQQKRAEAALKA